MGPVQSGLFRKCPIKAWQPSVKVVFQGPEREAMYRINSPTVFVSNGDRDHGGALDRKRSGDWANLTSAGRQMNEICRER